ncbi:recombinase family protein [Sphingomonas nostoxanthinifaciens]|uniref:recombinase family protein n=1 Tax=Sphingomonas nostoxanthinifaciens TaxID=2872652 RepID=UPI001CC1D75E|nr:recombinase family protein [Sphingomonas nostoxanthinifaciens]UAK25269.1 recombinase family protein [Sphingomonas nostoxanthinifaciens]
MTVKQVRCAIYTRKSTDEGLEQAFNSLDAQREACAAYILSQRHEGWTLLPDLYDDGGFSGGSMERPGLRQLLADVAAGKVDVIVVYKVDRLTRSLADFSRIVDVLEQGHTSFVSVTQAFNTTTSMGRLMLNVLLSFAQFEREVTGERIRDKIAASKRKGMFMGGLVPLGYALEDRKLAPHVAEAATVRLIFERYRALGSMRALARELAKRDVRTKRYAFQNGRESGGNAFTLGPLAYLLRNPIYIGEVRHKGERFLGEHEGIVDAALWIEVQAMLSGQAPKRVEVERATEPSLLTGMLHDGKGRPMTPSHAVKAARDGSGGRRRYRYYITRHSDGAANDGWRLPAAPIDAAVIHGLRSWLSASSSMMYLSNGTVDPRLIAAASRLGDELGSMTSVQRRAVLTELDANAVIGTEAITLTVSTLRLLTTLRTVANDATEGRITISVPAKLTRRGNELRLAFPVDDRSAPTAVDPGLVKLLAEAEQAYTILTSCGAAIPQSRRDHYARIARLKFLAPDIVTAILDGRQPVSLTRQHLIRASGMPTDWQQQRIAFGFR